MNKISSYFAGATAGAEKKLLVKIDWFVLSFCCLVYWVNYLDRLNLSNAYVSGMKEDLHMKGDEFNIINTCFNIGYIVALIPHNLILLKIRPRYWLPFCSFAWGLLTLGMYKATNYKQLCVIRFFQATFEALTFTGCHLILAAWYTEAELATRSAIFTSSGLVGNIFSSAMQAAIYSNMDMKNGIAGWRWLFIIDFIITVPITIYGFLLFPDTPDTCEAFYFSEEEIKLAKSRMKPRKPSKLDWSVFKRVAGNWRWYAFSFVWVLGGENESFGSNSLFALWLEYYNYTVPQRNHYPMGVFAVGIVANFICCTYVDITRGRYHWRAAVLIGCVMFISAIILLSNPNSTSHVFAAQYLSGFSFAGQPIFFSWANVACYNDLEERAIVLASMNMFSNAVNAWWLLLFYGASTAPKFRKGCYAMIATAIASVVISCFMRYMQLRDKRCEAQGELQSWESGSEDSVNKETQVKVHVAPVDSEQAV